MKKDVKTRKTFQIHPHNLILTSMRFCGKFQLPPMQFRCKSVVPPFLVRSSISLKSGGRAKAQ